MYKNNEGKIKFKLMHNFICNPPSRGYGQMIVWIMSRASIAPRSDIAKVAGLSRIQIFDCWRIKISRKRLRPRSGPVRQSSSCTLSGYGYIFNANTHIQGFKFNAPFARSIRTAFVPEICTPLSRKNTFRLFTVAFLGSNGSVILLLSAILDKCCSPEVSCIIGYFKGDNLRREVTTVIGQGY